MQQLPLDLPGPAPASLDNFVPGPNHEALVTMRALDAGERPASPVLVWGPPGSGKSHLLSALVNAAPLPLGHDADPDWLAAHPLLTLDDLESLDEAGLARLFLTLNRLGALPGSVLVIAARQPPDGLVIREDLRSRLAAGLVLALRPLSDEDIGTALRAMLVSRGLAANPAVLNRLMTRHTRDIRHLASLLDALDRFALARSRPLTVPLLREFERLHETGAGG